MHHSHRGIRYNQPLPVHQNKPLINPQIWQASTVELYGKHRRKWGVFSPSQGFQTKLACLSLPGAFLTWLRTLLTAVWQRSQHSSYQSSAAQSHENENFGPVAYPRSSRSSPIKTAVFVSSISQLIICTDRHQCSFNIFHTIVRWDENITRRPILLWMHLSASFRGFMQVWHRISNYHFWFKWSWHICMCIAFHLQVLCWFWRHQIYGLWYDFNGDWQFFEGLLSH